MLKKLLLPLFVLCAFTLSIVHTTPTYADTFRNEGDSSCNMLGLTSWDCGVEEVNSEDTLKECIWMILANIASDIAVIASYLLLGYVIYGGYLYIFSGGDTAKVATGKKALNQAFIGLAITLSANVIMGAIRAAFTKGGTLSPNTDANALITGTIQWVIAVAGVIAVIFVVGGGIMYITSAGDSAKLQKAKNMILYSLIGLVIVALAQVISSFISSTVRNANGSGNNQNNSSASLYITNSKGDTI